MEVLAHFNPLVWTLMGIGVFLWGLGSFIKALSYSYTDYRWQLITQEENALKKDKK